MNALQQSHLDTVRLVAQRYRSDGYDVILEPNPKEFPFDLGGYRPDLLAHKDGVTLIIEVKVRAETTSYEQYRAVVEETKRHEGWRFILVTDRDVIEDDVQEESDEFSWKEIEDGIAKAELLRATGDTETAYLILWIAFERSMRKMALTIDLPLQRVAPSIIIRQLYSQGELTMKQYRTALHCQEVRNHLVHGFRTADDSEGYNDLHRLLRELLSQNP